jgi:stromal membrane-associated protein
MVEATEAAKKVADASAPKVDFATDLFNLLSMDGPSENGSEVASNDDNGWAGFQCMSSCVWTTVTCYDLFCVFC